MPTQWRAKVKIKPSIVAEGAIVTKAGQVSDTLLLDTGAESNVISQRFTVTNEMAKLNTEIPHFLLLNDHFTYCYGAYLVKYWLKDSWGQEHNCEHVFYVLKKIEPDLVMSLSALEKKQVCIDCESHSWHFNIDSQVMSLKDSDRFEKTAEGPVTCALLWSVLKLLMMRLQDIAAAPSIPQTYINYADVFSKSEAECLPAHEKHDYVIDTKRKDPPHRPLYNLSDKKL